MHCTHRSDTHIFIRFELCIGHKFVCLYRKCICCTWPYIPYLPVPVPFGLYSIYRHMYIYCICYIINMRCIHYTHTHTAYNTHINILYLHEVVKHSFEDQRNGRLHIHIASSVLYTYIHARSHIRGHTSTANINSPIVCYIWSKKCYNYGWLATPSSYKCAHSKRTRTHLWHCELGSGQVDELEPPPYAC